MSEQPSEGRWSTLSRKIPDGLRLIIQEAEYVASQLNVLDCGSPATDAVDIKDAMERIYGEWLQLARFELTTKLGRIDGYERSEAWAAAVRDNYRCVICQHSDFNKAAGLESHHIVPRGHGVLWDAIAPGQPIHHASNKATLCHEHHELVTNPPDQTWHWRNIAPRLFELVGEGQLAENIRNHKGD